MTSSGASSARLAKALVLEGDTVRAVAAAEKGMSIVPPEKMPYDYFSSDLGEALAMAGKKEEAEEMFNAIVRQCTGDHWSSFPPCRRTRPTASTLRSQSLCRPCSMSTGWR
ncbi:MAG: hypothetical protein MZV63_44210 [Marinilabiliales bacterium]|nr:hypothetical protein [Marinilabiliales bacterium]